MSDYSHWPWRPLALAASLLLLTSGCDEKIDAFFEPLTQNNIQFGDLSGRVTLDGSGTAASVSLSGPTARTGTASGSGDYSFSGLTPGSYQVSATVSGAQCETKTVTVVAGQTVQADIACTSLPATIVVTVLNQGSPVSGASVTLTGPTPGTGVTNASGVVTFSNRTPGSYSISAQQTGLACSPTTASPSAGQTANATVNCTPTTSTIVVTVLNQGSPVSGATVTLSGPTPGTGVTNASGMVTFSNRTPGSYSISAQQTGLTCSPTTASPSAGQTANATVNCTPTSSIIEVTVLNQGSPVSGATVTLSGPTPGSGVTNASGMIAFGNLTPGTYSISAQQTGLTCTPTTANPAAGQTANATVNCTPSTGSIVVTVTLSGSPLSGAVVGVSGPTSGTSITGTNGVATFPNRLPGLYDITVSASGLTCSPQTTSVSGGQTSNVSVVCSP